MMFNLRNIMETNHPNVPHIAIVHTLSGEHYNGAWKWSDDADVLLIYYGCQTDPNGSEEEIDEKVAATFPILIRLEAIESVSFEKV